MERSQRASQQNSSIYPRFWLGNRRPGHRVGDVQSFSVQAHLVCQCRKKSAAVSIGKFVLFVG
jgi:hypothetical protein